jgi:hypothetical protein
MASAAFQRWWDPRESYAQIFHGFLDEAQPRAALKCDVPDERRRVIEPCGAETTGTPGLMMPAFSAAISYNRLAQPLLVVEIDRRKNGNERRDDIGGIEPATESGLEDHHVHAAPLESERAQAQS